MTTVNIATYIRPNGRRELTTREVMDTLEPKVTAIYDSGFEVTQEVIPGGMVSLTISDERGDYASRVSSIPAAQAALEDMIEKFDIAAALYQSEQNKDQGE